MDINENLLFSFDLGARSVGWAVFERPLENRPESLLATGVRIFDPAMEGDLDSGREESRNKARREARHQRRQTERRARRIARVCHLLQGHQLLPPGPSATPAERNQLLEKLDASLRAKWLANADHRQHQLLPYLLRAAALTQPLEPHELGRALYHLAQRRGFLSNRKYQASEAEEKEEGPVKSGYKSLQQAIDGSDAPTLGAYFATLDPTQRRIRSRYTHRSMFEREFAEIFKAQQPHHPRILTQKLQKHLHRALFHQRPLKTPKRFIGDCELEPGYWDKGRRVGAPKRCPWANLDAQRFRYLQKVNDLRIVYPDHTEARLSPEQRQALIHELETKGSQTFAAIRKLPLFKKQKFNLEAGGEKKLPGNNLAANLRKALGDAYDALTEPQRHQLITEIRSARQPDHLAQRAQKLFGLSGTQAQAVADVRLEPDYCQLSLKAIRKLLPHLQAGLHYSEARKKVYPESFQTKAPLDKLPPVKNVITYLRNPVVERVLTELRKVTNALIAKHGKPGRIHVELARELKRPKKARQEMSRRNRSNEAEREAAKKRVTEFTDDPNPSRFQIQKFLLAEECNWICPYSGRSFSKRQLFDTGEIDIEHIIPFSRSLDNSYINKTLCYADVNRASKLNKTPHEAFHHDPDAWSAILGRVRSFKGKAALAKVRRFEMEEANFEDFSSRMLNDTRYATKLACQYLGMLYGGYYDDDRRRIHPLTGQVTAFLRNVWGMNAILNDGGTTDGGKVAKSREDHRHHAVDAIAIAFATPKLVKLLSNAAKSAQLERRLFDESVIPAPWPNFVRTLRDAVDEIIVSHRVNRRLRGALHKETVYSRPITVERNGKKIQEFHVRKPLNSLAAKQIADIVDPAVRAAVQAKVAALGGGDPSKLFADTKDGAPNPNVPTLSNRHGEPVPIHRVRLRVRDSPRDVGGRRVLLGNNHHLAIYAHLDAQGNEIKWDGEVVSMLEALTRKGPNPKNPKPIIRRDFGPNTRFKFSLVPGDMIAVDEDGGDLVVGVVRSINRVAGSGVLRAEYVRHTEAREKKHIKEESKCALRGEPYARKGWFARTPTSLQKATGRKIGVSPIGEVQDARD